MKLLFSTALIMVLPISTGVSEEKQLTKDTFLEQLQGEWEIESRVNGGTEWKPAPSQKAPSMKVKGEKIFLPEGMGKVPCEMQEIAVTEHLISLTLVSKLGNRVLRRPALARLEEGKFTLVVDKFRAQPPESIDPSKTNLVQIWKRTGNSSNE